LDSEGERADADGDESGAAIYNAVSNLGSNRDSGALARPNTQRLYLEHDELVTMLRGTVYRRLVELHPKWATTKGWELTDDTDDEKPLFAAMRRLNVVQNFRRADTWGRALGESRILMVTSDPAELHEPLDPSKVTKLHRLEILDSREFSPLAYNTDPEVGTIGEPSLYNVHPRRVGVAVGVKVVHASRLLRFYGDDLPPSEIGFNSTGYSSWGADAIGQTIWDGIRNLSQTGAGGARLAQELSIAVFKVDHSSKSAGDDRTAFLAKIRALSFMKSISNAVWLKPNEGFERVAANPSGFKDLSQHAERELTLLMGAPMVLLYGETPSGLNTDGESWQRMWGADVASHQEDRYRDPLERLVEILYYSEHGRLPKTWDLQFNPLGELSAKELAEIRLIHSQADDIAILQGSLSVEDVRGRYSQPGGYQSELQPVEERPETEEPTAADPEDEEAARKMVEEALAGGKPALGGEPEGSVADPEEEKVSALALNGAQVQSAVGIVERVANKAIPRESGIAMLQVFYAMSAEQAESVMGEVGRSFEPASAPAPAPAPADGEQESGSDQPDEDPDDGAGEGPDEDGQDAA
jgi:phage-related protein (TIGR01555 family)